MKRFRVEVVQIIEVDIDEKKFDETFMEEFRQSFYAFDTIEDHVMHLAQIQARGVEEMEFGTTFVEGYGHTRDMGIAARSIDLDIDWVVEVKND